jgi:hypothetical protein
MEVVKVVLISKKAQPLTAPTRNWRLSAPQKVLWFNKVRFSASAEMINLTHRTECQIANSTYPKEEIQ